MMMVFDGVFFEIEVSPRVSGKTTRALNWLRDKPEGRKLIVFNDSRRDDLLKLPENHKVLRPENIVSLSGSPKGSDPTRECWVDDAGYILTLLLSRAGLILHPHTIHRASFSTARYSEQGRN